MAEFRTIAMPEIVVPERIRPVDEEHAKVIAASIASEGLLNPITVRATPNAKGGTYTLVAGAHRLRAVEMNGGDVIDAIIVKADKDAALLLEVAENLFRNELSVIDRAIFVQTYRELWEAQCGEIKPGGNGSNQYGSNNDKLSQLLTGSEHGFSQHVADRIGLSKRSIERLNRISQHLNPELRSVLRGTSVADNQSQLLRLAKLEPVKQKRMAVAFGETGGDLKVALSLIGEKASDDKSDARMGSNVIEVDFSNQQDEIYAQLVRLWEKADWKIRSAFMAYCRDDERQGTIDDIGEGDVA